MRQFFEDDDHQLSQMRLLCFVSLLASIAISLWSMKTNTVQSNFPLILTYVIGAFAPKAIQKYAEVLPASIKPKDITVKEEEK